MQYVRAFGIPFALVALHLGDRPILAQGGRRVEDDPVSILTRRHVEMLAAAFAITVLASPLDRPVQREIQGSDLQGNGFLQGAAQALAFAGGPGPFIAGAALYAGGRATGSSRGADLGVHLTEGVALAASISAVAKGLSGRALPDAKADGPGEFNFGRGFLPRNGAFVSFPSGHTAAGFAMATVFTDEIDYWKPGAKLFVAPIAYGGATLIGLARLYQNVHWASDLPLGAAIGIWSGTTVVALGHRKAADPIGRWLRGATLAPSAHHGLIVAWSSGVDSRTRH